MPNTPFPFCTDDLRGDVPTNLYPAPDATKGVILYGTPGLSEICDITDCTELRGIYAWGEYLYAVARRGTDSVLWRVQPSGTFVELGTISTSYTGPVWIRNNPTQLCIVDGVSGYYYTFDTGIFLQITDDAFPGASSMDYQDGYGLFTSPDSNEWFFSALYDFSSFDAGDFYSKEGKPDNIRSILSDHREPWLFGTESIEAWYNAGGDNTSAANPTFARNSGGLLEFGCGAAKSPANFDNSIAWLSDKGQLLRSNGYNAAIISNEKFGREIATYNTISDAIAFAYTENEHNFYQITFPTEDVTWVYDAKTKEFHKRTSFKTGGGFGRHRANCHTVLNNKHYVGDYTNGKIYEMSLDYLDEEGEEIQRILYSKELSNGMQRSFFPSVQIEVDAGVGLEDGTDPQIMLQYSDDGCKTWSSELWRSAGKIGDYTRRAVWNRMGSAYRRTYRITMTDKVVWRVLGINWWGGK